MYFELGQAHFAALAFFGGICFLLIILLGYFAWRLNLSRRQDRETLTGEADHIYAEGFQIVNRPIPFILILVILTVVLWGIAYAVLVATGVIDVA